MIQEEFSPENISRIFRNVNHKQCNSIVYDFAWDIYEKEKFIGELFYSNNEREWFFIKDSFPLPRKGFRINFPIKSSELFIELFKSVNVELKIFEIL